MKILIINDFTEKVGGAEIYCHRLEELLRTHGHQVKLIGGQGNLSRSKYRLFLSGWFNIKYYRSFGQEIQRFNPDVIHARNFYNNISLSFLLAAKKYNTPVIIHLSDFSSCICPRGVMVNWTGKPCETGFSRRCLTKCSEKEKLYDVLRWLRLRSSRFMLKKYVDVFISPSNILASYMKKNLGVSNVYVVPHFYNETPSKSTKNRFKRPVILYVGRLSKEKGIEYLLKAMPKVLEEIPKAELVIIGDGPILDRLTKLSHNIGINDQVTFHGYMPHEKVMDFYNSSSLLVLPTVWFENFPNVILEAMTHGLPVITTNIGGQGELVEDGVTGYHVEPCNSEDLAEKVLSLLQDKEMNERMGENAREHGSQFSPEIHLKRLERIYNDLVN